MALVRTPNRLDRAGAVMGLVAVLASLTPSLLPPPARGQGLVSGLAFGVGYGSGVALWLLAVVVTRRRLRPAADAPWWVVTLIGVAGAAAMMPLAVTWQNSVREAVGETATSGCDRLMGAMFFVFGTWLAFGIGRGVARGWGELPAGDRPQLVIYGLSLGSFGIQAAYEDMGQILERTDGAVLAGTPSFTPVWQSQQDARDEGSPYSLPVLDDAGHKYGNLAVCGLHQVTGDADPHRGLRHVLTGRELMLS